MNQASVMIAWWNQQLKKEVKYDGNYEEKSVCSCASVCAGVCVSACAGVCVWVSVGERVDGERVF